MSNGRKRFVGLTNGIIAGGIILAAFAGSINNEAASANVSAPSYSEMLMSTGNCWNGGEGNPLPNEAVVKINGKVMLITNDSGVGIAINQAMGGAKVYENVYGFCLEGK